MRDETERGRKGSHLIEKGGGVDQIENLLRRRRAEHFAQLIERVVGRAENVSQRGGVAENLQWIVAQRLQVILRRANSCLSRYSTRGL